MDAEKKAVCEELDRRELKYDKRWNIGKLKAQLGVTINGQEYQFTGKEPEAENLPEPVTPSAPAILLSMKGWSAKSDGHTHWVEDATGKNLGSFPTPAEAIRFLEGTSRHIRTR